MVTVLGKKYRDILLYVFCCVLFPLLLGGGGPSANAASVEDPGITAATAESNEDALGAAVEEFPVSGNETKIELTSDDCGKCHVQPILDIEAKGMAHKTKITCTDCHQTHPPDSWGAIPKCSNCHTGEKHFELGGCFVCHTNPHTPLVLTLTKDVTAPCVTCHDQQIVQLRQNQSYHTALACSACHFKHGFIPPCSRCHAPHNDTMEEVNCHECHKAHMPLVVTYGDQVPSEDCGSCHRKAFQQLAESPARHRFLKCATCHVERHKMIPECGMCHGLPHPANIHARFPHCGDCHGIAHSLTPTDVKHRRPRERTGADVGEKLK